MLKDRTFTETSPIKQRLIWHTPEPYSAAARYAHELITAITAEGVAVSFICPANYQFIEEFQRNPRVTLHLTTARSIDTARTISAKLWTNIRFIASSATVLIRTARKGHLVHFQHVMHFPLCAVFFAAALLRGCRIVFTVHDPVPHKWLLPHWLRWLDKGTLSWAYSVSKALIVHSEPGKRALLEQFGVPEHKIRVLGRGPYALGNGIIPMPTSETLELLLFGSLRQNKGIHLAIEAVQALHKAGLAVRLTIAGEVLNGNEAGYWEECLKIIARNPAPIRIIKEFIPDHRLPELFAECHCILLPYMQFFSDSGVAYMALANGRPIVATRAGGLGALFDAVEAGFVISEASTAGVTAAIEEVIRLGTSELVRRAELGAHYVNAECGWHKVAQLTCKTYADLLSQNPLGSTKLSVQEP